MIDIVISVQYESKANILSYDLDVRNPRLGLRTEDYPKRILSKDVVLVLDALLEAIEGVVLEVDREDDEGRLESIRRFEGIGLHLFEELIPGKLKRRLSSLASESRGFPVGTLQIRSNETFIPWELLRIPAESPNCSGVFLVEAFCLARTLFGFKPVTQLPLREIALVVPSESSLPQASDEKRLMLSLNGVTRRVTQVEAGYSQVTGAFERRQFDGWHFTGHGVRIAGSSNLQSLVLDAGELSSYDLHPSSGLGATRPLVFANTCYSGRGGHGLRRTGGLARAFLNAEAGAYIGSHWTISDAPAHDFAQEFYRAFCDVGLPIAEAVRCARLIVRDRYPEDPTWLAYTVFAHPQAECRFQSERGLVLPQHGSWHEGRSSIQIDKPLEPSQGSSARSRFPMGWVTMVPTLLIVLGLMGSRSCEPLLTQTPVSYPDFGPPAVEAETETHSEISPASDAVELERRVKESAREQEIESQETEAPAPADVMFDLLEKAGGG